MTTKGPDCKCCGKEIKRIVRIQNDEIFPICQVCKDSLREIVILALTREEANVLRTILRHFQDADYHLGEEREPLLEILKKKVNKGIFSRK